MREPNEIKSLRKGAFSPIVVNDDDRSLHTPDGIGAWYSARGAKCIRVWEDQYRLIRRGECVFCDYCRPKDGRLVSLAEALLFVERGYLPSEKA